ncbi:hypothetical protein, partial [Escherichia coli]|uniref:hypothetical protein n=1 Tax=Escherichia coli TaxID=562 RepID=UPI0023AB387F
MLSTASAPTFTETDSGIIDLKRIDKRAVIIATIANNVALNHSFLIVCFSGNDSNLLIVFYVQIMP